MQPIMNKIWPLYLFLFFSNFLFSQEDADSVKSIIEDGPDLETTVSVIPFSTSFDYDEAKADYPLMLAERVQIAIQQSKRFIVVDRLDFEKIIDIQEGQMDNMTKNHSFWQKVSDSHLVKAGRILGVEYIFTGNIANVATPITVTGGYGGEIGFTIKVISVETGKIFAAEDFNVKSKDLIGKNSAKEAVNAVLQNLGEEVKEFVDTYFPVRVLWKSVVERDRKGGPKVIALQGGLSSGLRKGQILDIVKIDKDEFGDKSSLDLVQISELRSFEKIGEVKIVEVFSRQVNCKVLDGEKKIEAILNDENFILIGQSRGYNSNFLRGN
ncbi:MAG: hypothetical protein RIC19_11200 [Phaeodactylibacter sp.]|uniref:hypothetical protein n=1 Tax=Phaeodactylibacter sp. TaxID=1940289 RepID=UPI0032EF5F75